MGELAELLNQRGGITKSATATSGTWHGPRLLYLTGYNILFASLWASVFFRAISHTSDGKIGLFAATEPHARWIQTASLIEVLHAAFGMSTHPSVCGTAYSLQSRCHQVPSQHNCITSSHPRNPSVDGVVQLSRKHSDIECIPRFATGLVSR
jgi:hypothetical protein